MGELLTADREAFTCDQVVEGLIGNAPAFRELLARLPTVAQAEAPVLITGETGTGKELVARAVHALSARAERPFVAVNCGALMDTLLESELFGHERGAFTDAHARRPGLISQAARGTLFLDELDDADAAGAGGAAARFSRTGGTGRWDRRWSSGRTCGSWRRRMRGWRGWCGRGRSGRTCTTGYRCSR